MLRALIRGPFVFGDIDAATTEIVCDQRADAAIAGAPISRALDCSQSDEHFTVCVTAPNASPVTMVIFYRDAQGWRLRALVVGRQFVAQNVQAATTAMSQAVSHTLYCP